MSFTSKQVKDMLKIDSKKIYYLRTHGFITGTEISPHEWIYDEESVRNCTDTHNRSDYVPKEEVVVPPIPSGHLNCDQCDYCIRFRECDSQRSFIYSDDLSIINKKKCDYYQHSLTI